MSPRLSSSRRSGSFTLVHCLLVHGPVLAGKCPGVFCNPVLMARVNCSFRRHPMGDSLVTGADVCRTAGDIHSALENARPTRPNQTPGAFRRLTNRFRLCRRKPPRNTRTHPGGSRVARSVTESRVVDPNPLKY